MNLYLSDPKNIETALELTELAQDELEYLVGRFKPDHHRWPGQLKGEVVVGIKSIKIRHHFTKKTLWERQYE